MTDTERAALRAAAETVLETQGCDWACAAYDKLMRGTHPAAVLARMESDGERKARNLCFHGDWCCALQATAIRALLPADATATKKETGDDE